MSHAGSFEQGIFKFYGVATYWINEIYTTSIMCKLKDKFMKIKPDSPKF